MVRRLCFLSLGLLVLILFLSGCAKRIPIPSTPGAPVKNPVEKLLEAFSSAESLQARASIRIETVRKGEEMNFLLNGFILYQRPDKLRIMGYHPLGMGVFDALYRNGDFFLLSPLQKRAYVGKVSEFEDLMEKAEIRISIESADSNGIPKRIGIEAVEKQTRVELRLKEVSVNSSLPEDSFDWVEPEGVKVTPLSSLLRGTNLK